MHHDRGGLRVWINNFLAAPDWSTLDTQAPESGPLHVPNLIAAIVFFSRPGLQQLCM